VIRRRFLKNGIFFGAGFIFGGLKMVSCKNVIKGPFEISLAQWSLHRSLFNKEMNNLDFISVAKTKFNISAVEYVNTFFFDKAENKKYLNEMNEIAKDFDVKNLLIMCDNEGDLGDPDKKNRYKAVENHYKWVNAAKILGCHSIRVNARSEGSYDEQIKLTSDGLRILSEFADNIGINILVENHGGLSSNGKWLTKVMKTVDHPRIGTLPDFGNFKIDDDDIYDRYIGVRELMPFAKAVSAKSHEFDQNGNEMHTDYYRMMKIVLDSGYSGYVGIEYEGSNHSESEGIMLTKKLLEKIQKN
tara:strand:+ start:5220 stop:6122 length:903 start_codon:yes stop_codon:yes gene_type:complete